MQINILAVVAVVILTMAIGFVWYSNILFAKPWMKLVGLKMEDVSSPGIGYLLTTVGSIVMAIVMTIFIDYTGTATAVDGAFLGLLAWLGFTGPSFLANYTFGQKPLKLYLIDSTYFLVVFVLSGALLAAWR